MATYYTGVLDENTINATRVPDDIVEEIMLLDADRTPFQIILSKLGKKSAHNRKFFWQEDEYMPYSTTTTGDDGGVAGTDTDLPVPNPEMFLPGDLVLCPEAGGEIMKVVSVDVGGGLINVTRGYIGIAGVLAPNNELIIIADINEDGSGARDINNRMVDTPWNYLQIIKTTFGMTGRQMETETYGPKEWGRIARKKSVEHKEKIERAFIFGERHLDQTGTHDATSTRGVLNWITTNIDDQGGVALTEANFDAFCRDYAFAHGSDKKLLLASKPLISKISGWAKGLIRMKPKDETYGINVVEYLTPFGTLDIVEHKFLTGNTYGYYGIVLDMETIRYRYFRNRDTKLFTNIQNPDLDLRKDMYMSDVGLEFGQEKRHAVIKNFT